MAKDVFDTYLGEINEAAVGRDKYLGGGVSEGVLDG